MSSYVKSSRTTASNKELDKIGEKIGKTEKQYSNLEEERLDIEKEAIYIKEKVFGQTWDSVGDRWKEEFNCLYTILEQIYRKDKEVQVTYYKILKGERAKDSRITYWNTDILSKCVLSEGVSTGKLPRPTSRDIIIQLGFLAFYDQKQINRLLNCAGMSELYVKGTRLNKTLGSNLNDYIYCKMISQNYPFGKDSFKVARKCIDYINNMVEKEVKRIRKEQKEKNATDPYKKSTIDIWNDIHKLGSGTEEIQVNMKEAEIRWMEESITYVKENIDAFVLSYTGFFAELTQAFEDQYEVVKRGSIQTIDLEDEDKENLYIKNLTQEWGKEFYEILCTAVNTSKHILKGKMVMPSRADIITLGLLLDCDYRQMKKYLRDCSMPELSASNRVEAIIKYALKNEKKVSAGLMFSLLGKLLDINHMDKDRRQTILLNPALQSLRTYEWIKLAIKATGIEKEAVWITDRYPEQQLFNWMIKTLGLE